MVSHALESFMFQIKPILPQKINVPQQQKLPKKK
jgi:hypothetical protein